MTRVLLIATACVATLSLAQSPGVEPHLSLEVSSPPASATPSLLREPLATRPPDKPHGVSNPKELTDPVKLVAADIMMDGSMSVCGKLRGANGKEFWFLRRMGPFAFDPPPEEGLYVGYMTGHIPESARAKFDGWIETDFWLLIEHAVKDAFRWDPESGRLVAKDPQTFDRSSQAQSFGPSAAKRLLRRAESALKREHSYMEPAKKT